MTTPPESYDLIVVGGGSGGIQCAKVAAQRGAKVAMLDFVAPSPQGTTWGLGGTCVNVGCIPKKLMHTAALAGQTLEDSVDFGWTVIKDKEEFEGYVAKASHFNWKTLVKNVQLHIKSLNFGYKSEVKKYGVKYINALGRFVDKSTIEAISKDGSKQLLTAKHFVIAVGGRPTIDTSVKGYEHCITSDDLFSMKKEPGKTLVIGASYVALECAGFLTGIGYDTTVMIRSIPLRGFDRQCAEKIKDHMLIHGTSFLQPCVPLSVTKLENGKLKVEYKNTETNETLSDEFDTVLFAIGRYPVTEALNLNAIGVKIAKSGKIIVNDVEQTSVPNIYAIGDCIEGGLELTPVAIQAGKLLALRLFGDSAVKMDYINVPTTVFTPLEYGCCGLNEEDAIKKHGKDNLKIYHKNYFILEYKLSHKEDERKAFMKIICDKQDSERVVGFHYLGPNAGEMTQGIGIAMKCRATKEDFDNTVGIHPTSAETMTTLQYGVTEDSGC